MNDRFDRCDTCQQFGCAACRPPRINMAVILANPSQREALVKAATEFILAVERIGR